MDFEFDNFQKDPVTKRNAYLSGKDCFMEIVTNDCSNSSVMYFSSQYEHFVDLISIKPDGEPCVGLYYELNELRCNEPVSQFSLQFVTLFAKLMPPMVMNQSESDEANEFTNLLKHDDSDTSKICMYVQVHCLKLFVI